MRIMHQILPEPRREQLEVALQYMSALQGQNLDSRSFQRLDKFLISAKRAAGRLLSRPHRHAMSSSQITDVAIAVLQCLACCSSALQGKRPKNSDK